MLRSAGPLTSAGENARKSAARSRTCDTNTSEMRSGLTLRRRIVVLAIILIGAAGGATPASAELSWDLYGGASWLQSADVDASGRGTNGATANLTIFDISAETGFTLGTRVGYWFGFAPFLGLDLDVFYMQFPVPSQRRTATGALTGEFLGKPISVSASGAASIPSVTAPLLGFAPEVRLRWPLMVDSTFVHGRLQPFLSLGPSWALSLEEESPTLQLGGKVGVGVSFQITPLLGLFGEYRYIFYPEFELIDQNITYEANLHTHSVVFGLSLRF